MQSVVGKRRRELETLGRDVAKLEAVRPPFPRLTYDEAVEILQKHGNPAKWGDDFGGDEVTILSNQFDRPVMIHRYPAAIKAFFMEPDPVRPGYGAGLRCARFRRDTAKSSAAVSASPVTTCWSSGCAKIICPKRRSSGIWTCGATAACLHAGFGLGLGTHRRLDLRELAPHCAR